MTSNTLLPWNGNMGGLPWILTAFGAIVGNTLLSRVVNAPDYLATVFAKSATATGGMLLWLINDLGIVLIGVLMFPLLKKQSESMALGYVSMRIFESIFLIMGVIFAMMLIPLSAAFINASRSGLHLVSSNRRGAQAGTTLVHGHHAVNSPRPGRYYSYIPVV